MFILGGTSCRCFLLGCGSSPVSLIFVSFQNQEISACQRVQHTLCLWLGETGRSVNAEDSSSQDLNDIFKLNKFAGHLLVQSFMVDLLPFLRSCWTENQQELTPVNITKSFSKDFRDLKRSEITLELPRNP